MNGNGSDAQRHYQDAMTAQLGERVTNLGRRQTDLETEMRSGFRQMETAVASLANEMRTSVAALSTNLAERNKPHWQALGVALTFCTILGALAYWPINAATSDLKASVASLAANMVTQKEMEWRSARGAEDRMRQEAALNDLRDAQVPRQELDRVWTSYDQRFADHQRQIDEVKQAQGSVYSQRDIILDLKENQQRLEREIARLMAASGGAVER
ncbi:hypothetical protein [Sinorhizobium americanum]|uniref:Uncharacterized protein n=1 Tax=Sinorhizobium americanum TaxID=194963 RepID=A0A1L3LM46_9HYPH|nr:hypothetical protein [Sinorhizobium americanum]APG91168.1 hypothetical protein SAMCFNEI73_Ch1879 [Sinorhizobium americanum]